MWVTEQWHRLPTGAAESSSLEMFNSCLDAVLGNLLCVALLKEGGQTR